jgi:transcriptional regulator with GAF, ATPase, and Fis domain
MSLAPPTASPTSLDLLCEGVRDLYAEIRPTLSVASIGVLLRDGADRIVMAYGDTLGTSGHRVAATHVLPALFERGHTNLLTPSVLAANPSGFIEARLLMTGIPDHVRESAAARLGVVIPLPAPHIDASLVIGLTQTDRPDSARLESLESVATRAAALLDRGESVDEELTRLRRLASLESTMGALMQVLDFREIFERLSALSRDALRHDFLSVAMFSDDRTQLKLYAQTAGWAFPESGPVQFAPILVDTFVAHLVDNLLEHPLEPSLRGTEFGARSSLRVPVRLNDRTVAAINFSSQADEPYRGADIFIARRIADYVALALSHHQLADESRRASALEERAKNLEVLDGLLNAITGVLDIREVFDRVSEIARRVLPHDMMALPLNAGHGSVLVYAVAGGIALPSPRLLTLSDEYNSLFKGQWEHLIYDDLQQDPFEKDQPPGKAGYRSLLRLAIRLEGRLAGVLDFGSRIPSFYTHADAVIGRRIADHVALVLSHQRLAEETLKAAALEARAGNLKMLDSLLNAITGVIDIREVFSRISEIASRVLPHDAMGLPIFTDDREHVIPYATTFPDGTLPPIQPLPESQKFLLTQPWEFHIADDIQLHPDGRHSPFARIGMHSLLRVPIRLDGELVGMLAFFSKQVGAYTQDDAILAKRIASHVALVISHQRLADESQRRAALQERQVNLEVLDGLLKTLTGVLDIRQVFARVSEISQRVLPHDAVAIGEVMPGGERIRMYASQGLGAGSDPFETPIRDRSLLTELWDYRIFDDINDHPDYAGSSAALAGMRSILFVPIRLEEGRLYGGLTFYAQALKRFTRDDVLIATRIADHIALALSHHRLAEESQRAAALQERQANLDALDGLLSTVAGVLDVRDVFDRISSIGNSVMPHDAMTIVVRTEVRDIVRLYAATGALRHLPVPHELKIPNPQLLEGPWEFELIDDIQQDTRYASAPSAKAGMRSLLTMPIRAGGELIGGVNFASATAGRFTRDDVPMARRITDHIALTLQHERLAEQMRQSEELRSRTANIALLDELLAAVTDKGELRAVIDRISELTQQVLPHDAMIVPVLVGDGAHVRFHVMRTGETKFPEVMEIAPHLRNSAWEYDLSDDLQADPEQRDRVPAKLGYRSALRVPIRVEEQLTAGVGFFSFAPRVYKQADVVIASRVAARLAISLMRERGLEASKRADEAAERASRLESRVQALTDELNSRAGFHRVIGKSPGWRQVLTQASQVAATETTVLLLGESGTGKEVVARFLHRASARKNGPFVALNCAALPEQLLESELFGYERGAFTGAMVSRAGKIEQAAGGVLFLDEVGEMSPAVQAKFLRVLQEREFQRLGGSKTLRADARVIAATNRDPKTAMERGQFREDLYYRLSVFEIALPPLRERRDDILLLVDSFMADLATNIGRPAAGLSEDAKDRLLSYAWPGNVRELRNAIERAVILCEGGLISSEHLPIAVGQARSAPAPAIVSAAAETPSSGGNGSPGGASLPGGLKLDDLERDLLNKAMAQARNNKSQAAKLLGVPRGQFYSLLKKHGMTDAKR